MKTAIIAAMALATVAGTPVFAQTVTSHPANDGGPISVVSGPATSSPRMTRNTGHGAYAAEPEAYMAGTPGVISYDRYAGWDPDPSIRLMLKRDATGGDAQ